MKLRLASRRRRPRQRELEQVAADQEYIEWIDGLSGRTPVRRPIRISKRKAL